MSEETSNTNNESTTPEPQAEPSQEPQAEQAQEAQAEQAQEAQAEQAQPQTSAPIGQDSSADRGSRDRRDDRRERGRGGRGRRAEPRVREPGEIEDTVVKVYRCATVVKGGRRFSFAALVVAGDRKGRVGVGYGKANEVPNAVEKASKAARRNMVRLQLVGTTIPHPVSFKYGASRVKLIPASEGTGVIAGACVRAVMDMAGINDVLTKCYGSLSPKNLVQATFRGLVSMRSREQVEKLREVSIG